MDDRERPARRADIDEEWRTVITLARIGDVLSRPFFETYAAPYALTLAEWRVIVVLGQSPGTTAQEISVLTGMHAMPISRAVARLRAAGRLVSRANPDDRRRRNLQLTEAGRELHDELIGSAKGRAHELLGALTVAERQFLGSILDRLLQRAREIS